MFTCRGAGWGEVFMVSLTTAFLIWRRSQKNTQPFFFFMLSYHTAGHRRGVSAPGVNADAPPSPAAVTVGSFDFVSLHAPYNKLVQKGFARLVDGNNFFFVFFCHGTTVTRISCQQQQQQQNEHLSNPFVCGVPGILFHAHPTACTHACSACCDSPYYTRPAPTHARPSLFTPQASVGWRCPFFFLHSTPAFPSRQSVSTGRAISFY